MTNKSSQADKAYKILKEKILNQELRPGSPVVENDLATKLNMSRTPVREAIRRLDSDGLLEIIPRKGSYIKTFTICDLIKLYEIAEGLEGMVAFLVAEKNSRGELSEDSIERLEAISKEMQYLESEQNFRGWAVVDEAFHRELYFLSDNQFIIKNTLRIRTQLNISLINTIPTYMDIATSNIEHRKILDAIKKGNSSEAREYNQRQHNRVRNVLISHSRVVGKRN